MGGVRVVCWTGFDGSGVWDGWADGGGGTTVVRVQILVGPLNFGGHLGFGLTGVGP